MTYMYHAIFEKQLTPLAESEMYTYPFGAYITEVLDVLFVSSSKK